MDFSPKYAFYLFASLNAQKSLGADGLHGQGGTALRGLWEVAGVF